MSDTENLVESAIKLEPEYEDDPGSNVMAVKEEVEPGPSGTSSLAEEKNDSDEEELKPPVAVWVKQELEEEEEEPEVKEDEDHLGSDVDIESEAPLNANGDLCARGWIPFADQTGITRIGLLASLPKKRPRRTALSVSEKNNVLNVLNMEKQRGASTTRAVENTAYATGVSEQSVYRIMSEYKRTNTLQSPKQSKHRSTIIEKMDDCDKQAIRRKVQEFFSRNEIPTIDKVLQVVNDDPDLPSFNRTTFYKLLKALNFKHVRCGRQYMLLENDRLINE